MHPTDRERGSKREDILDAAAHLFATVGFERTTTRALAEQARASTGTIYAHFPTKLAIREALLEQRVEALRARVEAAAIAAGPDDALFAGVRALYTGVVGDPVLGAVLAHRAEVTDRRFRERAEQ